MCGQTSVSALSAQRIVSLNDIETTSLKKAAREHLWMPDRDWAHTAEEGGPTIVAEGSGVRVTDSEGNTWIDVNGGSASVNVGYGRMEIADAAYEQMRRIHYYPQTTTTEVLVRLVQKLAEITPGDLERSWPTTGGSEANETAVKMARSYHRRLGDAGRYKIIGRRGSYHGATQGVMWLGGYRPELSDFQPAYPGAVHAPQPNPYRCERGGKTASECAAKCAQAIEELIQFHGPATVAAVIAEPVTHSLGAVVPGDEYWPMLRQTCDRYGVILIADEVVTGFGRTGKMFALDHWGVAPDIITVSNGLGSSYFPIAAAIATPAVADLFATDDTHFRQALTFGGHPVAAAAAMKNIEIIESEGLVQNAAETGAYLLQHLEGLMDKHAIIGDVRGLGLLLAIELVSDREMKAHFPSELRLGERLTEKFRKQGLLLRTNGETIGIAPPLCIPRGEVDEVVSGIDRGLQEIENELSPSA